MAIKSGTGMGGKTLNDRKLAADVRTLAMKEMKRILEGDDEEYKKQLILKLANTVLPRLTEFSGPDGGDIPIPLFGNVPNNDSDKEDTETE